MARWNLGRIIPFGVIWLLIGLVFILVETAAMGTSKPVSPTIINLTSAVIIFASIAVTIVGLLVGCVEIIFIENLFRKKSFLQKIVYKFLLYTLMMLLIISITYPIAASFELNTSILRQASLVKIWPVFKKHYFLKYTSANGRLIIPVYHLCRY